MDDAADGTVMASTMQAASAAAMPRTSTTVSATGSPRL
jgi:hypothetical protein